MANPKLSAFECLYLDHSAQRWKTFFVKMVIIIFIRQHTGISLQPGSQPH